MGMFDWVDCRIPVKTKSGEMVQLPKSEAQTKSADNLLDTIVIYPDKSLSVHRTIYEQTKEPDFNCIPKSQSAALAALGTWEPKGVDVYPYLYDELIFYCEIDNLWHEWECKIKDGIIDEIKLVKAES